MSAPAFLPADYAFAPSNRVVTALDNVRTILIKRMEMAGIVAADAEERGDDYGFDLAMRSVAAFRVAIDDIAVAIQREQGARQ